MLEPAGPNAELIRYWNEVSGPKWVALDDLIDMPLRPFGCKAMDRAAIHPGCRVLDVGCGCGRTSVDLARRAAPSGSVLGLDVSAVMIERAKETALGQGISNLAFELADAQTADLPEGSFDRLYSRFGVMFFSDPEAAFAHLRRALRSEARVVFVCWRALTDNPWLMVPLTAVSRHMALPPVDPLAPGPFAFADPERVRGLLVRAGYVEIAVEAVDEMVTVGGAGGLAGAVDFVMQMGPAARALRDAGREQRAVVARTVRDMLAAHVTEQGVRMHAGAWLVTAGAA